MACALLLSTILVSIGLSVQQLQNLKDQESVALGGTVTLSCRFSTGNIGDGNYPWWAQQKPGSKPRQLIYTTSTRPSDVPARFSGSRSGNVMSLTITGAMEEDECVYYCCVWTGSQYVFGAGTVLSILNGSPVAPSVRLYAPSEEEIKREKKATLVCLMDGFNPGVVKVDWEADGTPITSGVQTSKPTKQGNKYLASSYLSLTAAEWERHNTYNCKVTHEGNIIKKTVQRS